MGKRVELEGGNGAVAQWRSGRRGGATAQWWRDSDAVVVTARGGVLEMMPYGVIGLG